MVIDLLYEALCLNVPDTSNTDIKDNFQQVR